MAHNIFRRKALAQSGGRSGRRRPLWTAWCAIILLLAGGVGCGGIDHGITGVGVLDDRLAARSTVRGGTGWGAGEAYADYYFESADGGLTWAEVEWLYGAEWGTNEVATPRGVYRLRGTEIIRESPGRPPETVYSTEFLQDEVNVWIQNVGASHLEGHKLATRPLAIAYDPGSGNVVAALGVLGVLVGDADGRWTMTGVGPYRPSDFSQSGQWRLLLSWPSFWAIALVVPLMMLAFAFTAAAAFPNYAPAHSDGGQGCKAVLVFVSILLALLCLALVHQPGSGNNVGVGFLLFLATPGGIIGVFGMGNWRLGWRPWLLLSISFLAMMGLIFLAFAAGLLWVGALPAFKAGAALLCAAIALLLKGCIARRMPPPPPADVAEV